MTGPFHPVDMRVPDFLAFLDGRPDEERWELVGGLPIMMMTPPLIAHQRIASNVERALNNAIEARGQDRRADREIGLQIEDVPDYRPEPEVAVIDADYENERYASRFYGIVEVLSASDRVRNPHTGRMAIEDKLDFYRSHPFAEFVLVISQARIEIDRHFRGRDGSWCRLPPLVDARDILELPGLGEVCTLAAVYKGVKLDPAAV